MWSMYFNGPNRKSECNLQISVLFPMNWFCSWNTAMNKDIWLPLKEVFILYHLVKFTNFSSCQYFLTWHVSCSMLWGISFGNMFESYIQNCLCVYTSGSSRVSDHADVPQPPQSRNKSPQIFIEISVSLKLQNSSLYFSYKQQEKKRIVIS